MSIYMELEKENHRLKAELSHLKHHAQNLEAILNSIKSAKAFKFWQE